LSLRWKYLLVVLGGFAAVVSLRLWALRAGSGIPPFRSAVLTVGVLSLGMMISRGKDQLLAGHWWMMVFPGLALVILTVSVNLIGDWLRDEFDPRKST